MYAHYQTPRGILDKPPLEFEVYSTTGAGSIGTYAQYYSARCTWVERGAAFFSATVPFDHLARAMVSGVYGEFVVVARHNGASQLFVIEGVNVFTNQGTAGIAQAEITGASPWHVLYGHLRAPDGGFVYNREIHWRGSLNEALKNLFKDASDILRVDSHPDYDPIVECHGTFDSSGDVLLDLVTGTDHWVDFEVRTPEGNQRGTPYVVAKVKKYRGSVQHMAAERRPQIDMPEAESWNFETLAAVATDVVMGADMSPDQERQSYSYRHVSETDPKLAPRSNWARRWAYQDFYVETRYTEYEGPDPDDPTRVIEFRDPYIQLREGEHERQKQILTQSGVRQSLAATMAPTWQREFGIDGVTPLQYYVGDTFDVGLPGFSDGIAQENDTSGLVGTYFMPAVVTEVTVELGASGSSQYSVTPVVGIPDHWFADNRNMIYKG